MIWPAMLEVGSSIPRSLCFCRDDAFNFSSNSSSMLPSQSAVNSVTWFATHHSLAVHIVASSLKCASSSSLSKPTALTCKHTAMHSRFVHVVVSMHDRGMQIRGRGFHANHGACTSWEASTSPIPAYFSYSGLLLLFRPTSPIPAG